MANSLILVTLRDLLYEALQKGDAASGPQLETQYLEENLPRLKTTIYAFPGSIKHKFISTMNETRYLQFLLQRQYLLQATENHSGVDYFPLRSDWFLALPENMLGSAHS